MNNQHEEETASKSYDIRLLRRLLEYIKPHLLLGLTGIVLGTITAILQVFIPMIQGLVVADLNPQQPLHNSFLDWLWQTVAGHQVHGWGSHLYGLGLLLLATIIVQALLDMVQLYAIQVFGQRVIYDIRERLFAHLLDLPRNFFNRNPVGALVTRVSNDVQALQQFVAAGFIELTRHVFIVVAISIALPLVAWRLGWIVLSIFPLVVLAILLFRYFARKFYRYLRQQISRFNAFLSESVNGISILTVFHRQKQQRHQLAEIDQELTTSYIRSMRAWAIFSPAMNFIEGLTLAVIIYSGHGYVSDGEINLATLSVFIWLVKLYLHPMVHLAEKYNLLQSALAAAERIFSVLDTAIDPTLVSEPTSTPAASPTSIRGQIEFCEVIFGYDKNLPVLQQINLKIDPGKTVAIVGHTGAGKSTLARLLLRYYNPDSGRILVDGCDLASMPTQRWRRWVTLVPQDVFIFHGSILENIRLWDSEISESEVKKAAQSVYADQFICRYQQGYHHPVEESGKMMSSGERQLISFARAIVQQPRLLILDEATSLIDTPTEKLIQKALQQLTRNRTSIIIAHRLSTIQEADKIVVMQHGKIVDIGTHQQLLAKSGPYHRLYYSQNGEAERVRSG